MKRGLLFQFVSVLIILTIAASGISFAAEKKSAVKKEAVKKEEKQNYPTQPFDIKVTALPPNYPDNDIVAILNHFIMPEN